MNEKSQQLYNYLKSNGLTDLDSDTFFSKYSDPNKAKEIWSYLNQNGMTDLDANAFYDSYFKKKSLTDSGLDGSSSDRLSKTTTKPTAYSSSEGEIFTGYPGKEAKRYNFKDGGWYEEIVQSRGKVVQGQYIPNPNIKMTWTKIKDPNRISNLNKQFSKDASLSQVEEVFNNYDEEKADNQYRIYQGQWQRMTPGSKWHTIQNEGSINALNKRYGKNVSTRVATTTTIKPVDFKDITADLVSKTEEKAIDYLKKNYSKYGFEFSEEGLFAYDQIKVRTKDGSKEEVFEFDEKNPKEADRLRSFLEQNASKQYSSTYNKLKDLSDKGIEKYNITNEYGSSDNPYKNEIKYTRGKNIISEEFINEFKKLSFDEQKDMIENVILKQMGNAGEKKFVAIDSKSMQKFYSSEAYKDYKQKKIKGDNQISSKLNALYDEYNYAKSTKDPAKIRQAKNNIDSYITNDVIKDNVKNYDMQLNDLQSEALNIEKQRKFYEKEVANFNQAAKNGSMTQQEYDQKKLELENMYEAIQSNSQSLLTKRDEIIASKKKLNLVAGKYITAKEKEGGTAGFLLNKVLTGISSTLIEPLSTAGMGWEDRYDLLSPEEKKYYHSIEYNGKKLTKEQIENMLDNEATLKIRDDSKKAIINTLGSEGTTLEYMKSDDRGWFTQAIGGVLESLPAMATGALGRTISFTALASQAYSGIEEEMLRDPDFKYTSAAERSLIAIPYAAAMGALENIGLKNLVSAESFGGKVLMGIALKTAQKAGATTTFEALEKIATKEIESLVAKGAIKILQGGIAEFETGFTQSLVLDQGLKQVYNWIKESNLTEEQKKNLTQGEYFDTANNLAELGSRTFDDALAEMIGGHVMSTAGTLFSAVVDGNVSLYNAEDVEFLKEIAADSNFKKLYIAEMKSQMLTGNITKSKAQQNLDNLNEIQAAFEKMPSGLTVDQQKTALDLISERARLESEIKKLDPALAAAQTERVNAINDELKQLSYAVQEQTTSEVPIQSGTAVGGEVEERKPETGLKEITQKGKEEVDQYIANIGAEARVGNAINPVMEKMANAEYINDNEIDNAIEAIFNEVESLEKSDQYSPETKAAISDKLLSIADKLDNYEFRTKTETVATTKAGAATTTRRTSEAVQKIRAEKYFDGVQATVNGQEVTLKDNNGRVEAQMPNGEVVVLDTPTMEITEDGFEFDDSDALVAVTVTDRLGNKARLTGDQALDFAIRDRENKLGVVEQAEFDTVYQEVEKKYIKEVPTTEKTQEVAKETEAQKTEEVVDERQKLIDAYVQEQTNLLNQLLANISQEERQEVLDELTSDPVAFAKKSDSELSSNFLNSLEQKPTERTEAKPSEKNLFTKRNAKALQIKFPNKKEIVKAALNIINALPGVKIYLHENTDQYVQELAARTGESKQSIQSEDSAGSYIDGEIHLDMSKANVVTLLHEAFHHAFLTLGVKNGMFIDLAKGLRSLVTDKETLAELDEFVANYSEETAELKAEEFAAQLGGILAANREELTTTKLTQFKALINRIAKKIGLGMVFSAAANRKEAADFINAITRGLTTGENLMTMEPYTGGSAVQVKDNALMKPKYQRISKYDVDFTTDLPTKTLKEVVEKYEGRVFVIQSDATGVGYDSNGDPIYGGIGYIAIKDNVDGKIGFASVDMKTARTTISKMINRYGPNEKVAVLVMAQNPSSTVGNYYGGKYFGRGLIELQKQSKTNYKAVAQSFIDFIESKRSVVDALNKNKTHQKLIDLIKNPGKYDEVGFAQEFVKDTTFDVRREILKTLLPEKSDIRTNKSTPYIKQSLKDLGFNRMDFLNEYGDNTLFTEEMYASDEGGLLAAGFEMTLPNQDGISDFVSGIENKGIKHHLFNGKLPYSDESFLLDGLYPMNENFSQFAKPQMVFNEEKLGAEKIQELVRKKYPEDKSYEDKFTNASSKNFVPRNNRTYTHLTSANKIKFKEELLATNPEYFKEQTPDVATDVARGMGFTPERGKRQEELLEKAKTDGFSKRKKQLIGKNAYLSKNVKDNLSVAKKMEADKKLPIDIRIATGWEKGVDNKWRYEIEDVKINNKLKDLSKEVIKTKNTSTPIPLSQVTSKSNALLTAYPNLADTIIIVTDVVANNKSILGAHGLIDGKDIILLKAIKDYDLMESTLVHEIQHAIQEIEGFAKGTNVAKTYKTKIALDRAVKLAAAEQKALDRNISFLSKGINTYDKLWAYFVDYIKGNLTAKENYDYVINKLGGESNLDLSNDYVIEYLKENSIPGIKDQKSLINMFEAKKLYDQVSGDLGYLSTAGEVESRNVEARRKMSAKERLNTLLSETENIPRSRQIIDGKIARKKQLVYNASPRSVEELGKRSGVVYFATDKREAEAYAEGNRGQVREFEIPEDTISDEKVVLDKINELDLQPKDKQYTIEESNLYELIDDRFDNSLSQSDINKLFNALKKDGVTAFRYKDGAQVVEGTTESIAVIDTDVVQKSVRKKQISPKQKWAPTPVKNMNESPIAKNSDKVRDAAVKLIKGLINVEEYRDIVNKFSPIKSIGTLFAPASTEHMELALGKKADKLMAPVVDENGNKLKKVGTRLDIPSYLNKNAWVVTVHDERIKNGPVVSYRNAVKLKNVEFSTDPRMALNIAAGLMGKSTFARMVGEMEDIPGNTAEEQGLNAQLMVEDIMNDPNWVQVGMNPFRHSFFWNRETGMPVVSADEVIQIGGLVYAKNAKEVSPNSDEFTVYGKYDEAKNKVVASEEPMLDKSGKTIKFQKTPKILGVKPTVVIVNDEQRALVDQIKLEVRAQREQKKAHKQVLADISARVTALKSKGNISVKQFDAIMKNLKRLNFDNAVKVDAFIDYVSRALANADYIDKVQTANKLRKSIASKLKGKANPFATVAKIFTTLDPRWSENINDYIAAAQLILDGVKPSTTRGGVLKMKSEPDLQVIAEYINEEQNRQMAILAGNLKSRYEIATGKSGDGLSNKTMLAELELLKPEVDNTQAILDQIDQKLAEYSQMLTDEDPQVVEDAINIDTDEMSVRDAIRILESLDTYFTNGLIAGMEALVSVYKGQQEVKAFRYKSKPMRTLGSKDLGAIRLGGFAGFTRILERKFRSVDKANDYMIKSGINGIITGANKADFEAAKKQDLYIKKFKKIKGFYSNKNIYERGMIADLIRTNPFIDQEAEFQRVREIILDSRDMLINSKDDVEVKMGKLYNEVIKKLGLENSDVTVEDILERAEKYNVDAVNFAVEMFAEKFDQMSDTALGVYNTMLSQDINYTPKTYVNLKGKGITQADQDPLQDSILGLSSYGNVSFNRNEAGVLMPITRPAEIKSANKYVDLNFDNNMFRSYRIALTDSYTAKSIHQLSGFYNTAENESIIDSADDFDILKSALADYINTIKGKNYISKETNKKVDGTLNKITNILSPLGAARALAGVGQFVNQLASGLSNTVVNVGEYIRPSDMTSKAFEFMNRSGQPIANVGENDILISLANFDKAIERSTVGKNIAEVTIDKFGKFNAKAFQIFVSNGDAVARRLAWMAYYRKYISKNNLGPIDFNAEPNTEAAAYAQSMVDRSMDTTDPRIRGSIYRSQDSAMKLIKTMLIPFSSFGMNQRNRMWTDLTKITTGDFDLDTARSLASIGAEIVVYNAIRYVMARSILYAAMNLLGYDDEEQDELIEKLKRNMMSSSFGKALVDVVSPIAILDNKVLELANYLMSWAGVGEPTDDDVKKFIKEENELRKLKGDDPLEGEQLTRKEDKYKKENSMQFYINEEFNYGQLGIQWQKSKQAYDVLMAMKNGYYVDEYGRNVYFDSEAKQKLPTVAALAVAGSVIPLREVGFVADKSFSLLKKNNVMSESKYDMVEKIKKEFGRMDPVLEKLAEKKSKIENVKSEMEWIKLNTNGGLKGTKEKEEYAKLIDKIPKPSSEMLDMIQRGKTAQEIIDQELKK